MKIDINKIIHRNNCLKNLPFIKNITDFTCRKYSNYETVLIEFREFEHLEYIIRTIIIKLPDFKHSIVCGNINYNFMKTVCNNISKNIKIIKLDIDNLNATEYSRLLLTQSFWENFTGEKILLYQEDSIIFNSNISSFMKYDYVGAPWSKDTEINGNNVGNGGFSLRTKNKMIECILNVPPSMIKINLSTRNYMISNNIHYIPEDVYFSTALINYNIGIVAPYEIALEFSQESQLSKNPLGGHQYWLSKNIFKLFEDNNIFIHEIPAEKSYDNNNFIHNLLKNIGFKNIFNLKNYNINLKEFTKITIDNTTKTINIENNQLQYHKIHFNEIQYNVSLQNKIKNILVKIICYL